MLGYYGSGRTTLLYNMKLREIVAAIPTVGFNVEPLEFHTFTIHMWDLGGGCKIREIWHHYYANTQIVLFLIDGNDQSPDVLEYNRSELKKAM